MRHPIATPIQLALALTVFAPLARAQGSSGGSSSKVTTYVIKVQEEREQTRWTLTEWLRIKERMRMMDLWLAMFSDPKKDRFSPELMLSYGLTRGRYSYDDAQGRVEDGALAGNTGRAQLWLTNLISGTVGIRTLNIDLGGEYYRRQTAAFSSSGFAAGSTAGTAAAAAAAATPQSFAARDLQTDYYTGNLRIFGRNVQDSSLVLKYGRYRALNDIVDPAATAQPAAATPSEGLAAGAELQLYLLRWLGAEGNYMRFGDSRGAAGTPALRGSHYDYVGFIEISLVRLMAGLYAEEWEMLRGDAPVRTRERGSTFGVKLQF